MRVLLGFLLSFGGCGIILILSSGKLEMYLGLKFLAIATILIFIGLFLAREEEK